MTGLLRVVVQDSRRLVREGLSALLGDQPDLHVVGAVSAVSDILALLRAERPDVIVLGTPEREADRLADPAFRVVPVMADEPFPALLEAIRGSADVQSSSDPVVSRAASPEAHGRSRLTSREVDIIRGLARGLSTSELSALLGISQKTVENHKQRIFAKLGVRSQAHAVARSIEAGLLVNRPSTSGGEELELR